MSPRRIVQIAAASVPEGQGGRGTADMVRRAHKAGVPVIEASGGRP